MPSLISPDLRRATRPASVFWLLLSLLAFDCVQAITTVPGDLNDDFDTTVADIAILISHIQGTQFIEPAAVPYVDFDLNGNLDSADVEMLVELVMDSQGPQAIPMAAIKETLPKRGESNVGVKRETILYFTLPLAEDAVISNDNFFALFGGEKLLTRIEVSSDRLKATLFYIDPLPDNSRVRVIFDGAGIKDILGRDFDPDRDGEAGGIYGLDFNTVSITELQGTAISGTVYQSRKNELDNDVPLSGVVIEVVGAEETIRATTAGDGSFTLDPCPAGRFFVNVDGRPVTGQFPTGAYYPFVGKAWYARPGRTDNLVNEDGRIYLPLVAAGSLKSVSQTASTVVEFPQAVLDENPALSGVRVTVPANSLFNEEGTRGGMVGIAPVAPDRIPEPLPEGLNLPIVITVQTDGPANFDRPAPVVFPNVPDPETGVPLPPGSKSALWSFNHDSGEWELGGPMTVSADGQTISSDPGIGIRQPGWHGSFPWSRMGGGGAADGDFDDDCNDPNGCEDDEEEEETDCETFAALAVSGVVQGALNTALAVPKSLPAGAGVGISAGINHVGFMVDSFIAPDRAGEFLKGVAFNNALSAAGGLINAPSPDPYSRVVGLLGTLPSIVDTWVSAANRGLDYADCVSGGGSSAIRSDLVQILSESDSEAIMQVFADVLAEEGFPKAAKMEEYLTLQIVLIEAIWEIEVLYYGNGTWLFADADPLIQFIFEKLVDDFIIDESEKASILSSSLKPAAISDSDINVLVDLLNDRYTNGLSESDRLLFLAASQKIKAALEAIRDNTPYTDFYFFWNYYLPDLWLELFPPPRDPEAAFARGPSDGGGGGGGGGGGNLAYANGMLTPEPGEHYYKLLNMNDRFVVRGQTNQLGQVDDLNLPPNTAFVLNYYKPDTNDVAVSFFRSPEVGQSGKIPVSFFFEMDESELDSDGDNAPDIAEDIAGTDPNNPDSDGDGVLDGAEMAQDSNPLDNTPASVGIVASIPTQSDLDHLIARNDYLVGASSSKDDIRIFDISSSFEPVLIGSYKSPTFRVEDIAWQGNLVAVATGLTDLLVIDISDPVSPVLFKETTFAGDSVTAVAMRGNFIYAGLESGTIATVDALTGLVIAETEVIGTIDELVGNSRYLYAFTGGINLGGGQVRAFEKLAGVFPAERDSFMELDDALLSRSQNLFLGNGLLYSTVDRGYMTFDLSDPAVLDLSSVYDLNQFGWKEFALNGSGLMLAATSANSTFDGDHDVDLFGVGASGFESTFIQTITTPDVTKSLTLYNGIAYAGGTRLNVINYLATDTGTEAPTIALGSETGTDISEGASVSINATVMDDVQVRNVDFYVDDSLITKDGNYPFSFTFAAPLLADGLDAVTISARAFDTAGNSAWSDELVLNLGEDLTPPFVFASFPSSGSTNLGLENVGFVATEKLDPNTLNSDSVYLLSAGGDFQLGTSDDFVVAPDSVVPSSENNAVYLNFDEGLETGQYQLNVTTAVTDLTGIPLGEAFQSTFRLLGVGDYVDTDGDGLSDELEEELKVVDTLRGIIFAFDPFNADTNGDGINDGEEDFDEDGLTNLEEFLIYGTKLKNKDSDNDNLDDFIEVDVYGTNPALYDTDGDLVNDGWEINVYFTDPLDVDSDDDLLDDGSEAFRQYNPRVADTALPHAVSAPVVIYRKSAATPSSLSSTETLPNQGSEE